MYIVDDTKVTLYADWGDYEIKSYFCRYISNKKCMIMANENNNIQATTDDSQIVLYQPDESISLQVKIEEDTVWLTQAQMVELFGSSKANISEHITNIYQQGELMQSATVRKFRTVSKEGNRMITRNIDYSAITLMGTSPEVILSKVE